MRHFFLAILLVLFGSGSAVAQSEPDTVRERTENRSEWETREALRYLNGFSRCVGDKYERLVDPVLRMPLHSKEQSDAVRAMMRRLESNSYSGCARTLPSGAMRIGPPAALLGGMAESRFVALGRSTGVASLPLAAKSVVARNDWEDFGLCIVQRNSAGAVALVETKPMSKQEEDAIRSLTPDFGPCVYQDSKIAMDSFALRTYLAVGLFLAADSLASADKSR